MGNFRAFGYVECARMWNPLRLMNTPENLIILLGDLFNLEGATIKMGFGEKNNRTGTEKGMH